MPTSKASVICPVCDRPLGYQDEAKRTLLCDSGHRFDAAKQGYFNFLTGKGTNFLEDTSPMVQARDAFQSRGHYAPLAMKLSELVQKYHAGTTLDVLDAGAGTGYYLKEILDLMTPASQDALALDISRFAMRRAAKLPNTVAVVWDVWRKLPTSDASRDIVLNCFAPHNPSEFHRVLRPTGVCVVVTGEPDHLKEVIEPLGMLSVAEGKLAALKEKFAAEGLIHSETEYLSYQMELGAEDLYNLAFMGPAGHHLSPETLRAKVQFLGRQLVTASFGVHVFIPKR
ncbi:methyltransferase domain-containing protein [Glutamicibacter sp. JL.03c]|uniref:putative RNA methyltransferase n=1 Tax=Glutamicibacter sp. JL.03c TaxID=2984842 RepID=UPI0021F6F3DE|nr:methyltransferase domain-containing protein [Glutamicibacter sp. JL.03c]UYQ79031.1 methyltransferase domain-containing protein [Glutamicibacter sp. JL.03c]